MEMIDSYKHLDLILNTLGYRQHHVNDIRKKHQVIRHYYDLKIKIEKCI